MLHSVHQVPPPTVSALQEDLPEDAIETVSQSTAAETTANVRSEAGCGCGSLQAGWQLMGVAKPAAPRGSQVVTFSRGACIQLFGM